MSFQEKKQVYIYQAFSTVENLEKEGKANDKIDYEIASSKPEQDGFDNIILSKKETKSKRIPVLMKPSLVAKVDDHVKSLGISRNEFITQLVEYYFKNMDQV